MGANTQKFVVVDVETTGFGRSDRIVEIAAVTLDPATWDTIDEYDTLINPERDVGPTGVHGITAAMVEAAPTFTEVIAAVAGRLRGAVLIAHNLVFDERMLRQEFDRRGVGIDPGEGLCTYRATKKKLCLACDEFHIPLSQHHRALADARATAELARQLRFSDQARSARAASIGTVPLAQGHHTLRRGLADAGTSPMHRVVSCASYPDCDSSHPAVLGHARLGARRRRDRRTRALRNEAAGTRSRYFRGNAQGRASGIIASFLGA